MGESPPGGETFSVRRSAGWIAPDGGYTQRPGSVAVPITVSVRTNAGFVPSAPPTLEPLDGGAVAALSFAGLPSGERYVEVRESDARTIYIVNGDHLDFGFDAIGRFDAVLADAVLHLIPKDGSVPDAGESEPESFLGGSLSLPLGKLSGTPPAWTIQKSSAGELRLLDRARGDVAWVKREGAVTDSFRAIVEACSFPEQYQMAAVGETTVEVTCAAAPKKKVSILTKLDAFRSLVGAGPELESETVIVSQTPPGNRIMRELPWAQAMGDRVGIGLAPLDAAALDFDFVDPASGSWPLMATIRLEFQSGAPTFVRTVFKVSRALPDPQIEPVVGPVRGVSIEGRDLLQPGPKVERVGLTPTVVLTPPDTRPPLHAPTSYHLTIYALDGPDGSAAGLQPMTEIVTSRAQVVLPPNVLAPGKDHIMMVAAQYAEPYSEQEPFRGRFPSGEAAITTNVFVP